MAFRNYSVIHLCANFLASQVTIVNDSEIIPQIGKCARRAIGQAGEAEGSRGEERRSFMSAFPLVDEAFHIRRPLDVAKLSLWQGERRCGDVANTSEKLNCCLQCRLFYRGSTSLD